MLCFDLAIAFKNAKAYDDAIASYMKQADVQKQTGSYAFCQTFVMKYEQDFCDCYVMPLVDLVFFYYGLWTFTAKLMFDWGLCGSLTFIYCSIFHAAK